MTREELIKRLSYRNQFNQPVVDNKGLGELLDETIAMLEMDDDIISDLETVLEFYRDKYDGYELAIKEIKKILQGCEYGKMDADNKE